MDVKELIGVTLGTCTLERIIGRGGMGAVFLAQQSRPVRTVAVKVLIPSSSSDPEQQQNFLERFRREADTVAKLEHKNILPVYEYDEAIVNEQHLAYLVMPYIRGGTLRERMEEMKREGKRFDLRVVVSYVSQVAEALDYAHSMGVVHRDVKPGNLLFHLDGRLLLSDFGIVRLKAMPALTTVGNFLGTAEYASPEQISTNEVDYRSDIYSLGIILYELLTGTVPFTGQGPFAVMTKQLSDPVPPPRTMRPDLSPAIEAVVMKALAKNPVDRYQSVLDLSSALRAAVSPATSASALRLPGDANNVDLTVAEPLGGIASHTRPDPALVEAVSALPPTRPAVAPPPPGGTSVAPWQQSPRPWQWPSQAHAQVQVQNQQAVSDGATHPALPVFHEGHRLFYYGTALIALILQFPTFILLYTLANGTDVAIANLGILLGTAINMLALAAMGFAGIVRPRTISPFLYRCLAVTIIAPVISGFFINFGDSASWHPLLAYLVLLVSNIYALRQLARVDAAHEQIELAPVYWRPAMVGALTGLLPLVIILIFVFATSTLHAGDARTLLNVLNMVVVILIAAPTPGAVLAVWLSEKMSVSSLVRTSATAGMLMFCWAFLLMTLWGLTISQPTFYFLRFNQPWWPILLWLGVGCTVGLLRGLLDAWIYLRIKGKTP